MLLGHLLLLSRIGKQIHDFVEKRGLARGPWNHCRFVISFWFFRNVMFPGTTGKAPLFNKIMELLAGP